MPAPDGPQFKFVFGDILPRLAARHRDDFHMPVTALAYGTPEDPYADVESAIDLPVSRERVNVSDLPTYGGQSSERVAYAQEGYRNSPSSVPPLLLVKRAGEYLIADGHHRARAARREHKETLPAWVVHSPLDTPYPSGDEHA